MPWVAPPCPRLERGRLAGARARPPSRPRRPPRCARRPRPAVLPPREPGGPCSSPSLGPNRTCFRQNAPVLSPVPGFDGTRD